MFLELDIEDDSNPRADPAEDSLEAMTRGSESDITYKEFIRDMEKLGAKLVDLFGEVLLGAGVVVHSVNYRVKTEQSANRKLQKNQEKYTGYGSLTDILGLRVVCYFPDQVGAVADHLVKELTVDHARSVDKRELLSSNQFGYLSKHYIASLSAARAGLVEYARFKDTVFELQIRSLLQHAWAEIEHDLRYKSPIALPEDMNRRFSRLASNLESVDEEFKQLRKDITKHLAAAALGSASDQTADPINAASLAKLCDTVDVVARVDATIAQSASVPLQAEPEHEFMTWRSTALTKLGVANTTQVRRMLEARELHIRRLAELTFSRRDHDGQFDSLSAGISLFYLEKSIRAERLQSSRSELDEADFELARDWLKVMEELGAPPF